MKIAVSADGTDLDAGASPVFGRCQGYVFVDTESLSYEGLANPALSAAGGAGIQAAQFVVGRGVDAVVSGNVGPNAFNVLDAAGVVVYLAGELAGSSTVRQVVDAYNAGELSKVSGASAPAHAGMGRGRRR